jgi:hypothetical protein
MQILYTVRGKDHQEKVVSAHSNGKSGYIYLPGKWIGKKVLVVLDPEEIENE